ncbi:MAG: hypothetical protein IJA12_03580 [Oscillospiraceae bacterium]|nr:hypothetical protein [Oscillospiraceae bacterium]
MKITEKYVVNLILSIVLVFSSLGVGLSFFAKEYILSSETFIDVSDEKDIPQKVYDEINEYFVKSEAYSGIPADVYMSAISVDDIENLIDMKLSSLFTYIYAEGEGERDDLDFLDTEGSFDYEQKLEKNVTDFFDEFALENNVEVDDNYNAQLQKTIDTANSEINNFTDVYMLSLIDDTGIIAKIRTLYKFLDPIIYACAGLTGLCVVLIIVFSRKYIANIFYWIATSVMCMSVLSLVPVLVVKLSGITDRLIIRNKCTYTAYTALFSDIMNTLVIDLIFVFAVGAVILSIGVIISKIGKKNV